MRHSFAISGLSPNIIQEYFTLFRNLYHPRDWGAVGGLFKKKSGLLVVI